MTRYLLWDEQNRMEIYEDECTNISICDVVGADPKYDIEHTIPRSRSWDNSMMNRTLCSKAFNRIGKGNKIPFELGREKQEEILLRINHWKERFEKLDNEIKNANPSRILDPDKRNAKIVEKHLKTFERDYLKGKYERFEMEEVPTGFKNSQIRDTGLITRFARNYLSCLFRRYNGSKNVQVVNGIAVDQFRRAWGLQKEYEKKSRTNHIHHCIDAVTIACMTKKNYDAFAEAWRKAEEEAKYDVKKELAKQKPWGTFTEDVKNLEKEVLIVHTFKDNLPKQSKKKKRKRGKIVPKVLYEKDGKGNIILLDQNGKKKIKEYVYAKDKNGRKIPIRGKRLSKDEVVNMQEGEEYFVVRKDGQEKYYKFARYEKTGKIVYKKQPVYLRGDTVRGPLHKQNYIGAIAQPKIKNGKSLQDNGKFILQKDADGEIARFYVKRNPVTKDFSASDVKKIVDKGIKKRIEKHGLKKVITKDGHILLPAEKKGENGNDKNLKEMLIKKIRMFEKDKPIEVKPQNEVNLQTPKALRKKHKHFFYAQNDGNYCMAIYEGKNKKGKIVRAYELINNLDAGMYYKLSNQLERETNELVPRIHLETGYKLVLRKNEPLTLKKGINIILLKNTDEEPEWMNQSWLNNRFYTITGIDDDGIKLSYHQEARPGTEVLKFMNEVINKQKFKNVIPDLKNIDGVDVAQLWKDFDNPQIKKKNFFENVQKTLNEYYEQNAIKVKKKDREEIKKIKLRKSGLTTPKGGLEDFINNHCEFPYVKLKVNDFNALIEGFDFKISQTGKIEKL